MRRIGGIASHGQMKATAAISGFPFDTLSAAMAPASDSPNAVKAAIVSALLARIGVTYRAAITNRSIVPSLRRIPRVDGPLANGSSVLDSDENGAMLVHPDWRLRRVNAADNWAFAQRIAALS